MTAIPRNRRQSIRMAIILFAFLLFPITMNYLSPYVIIDAAANGVVNGSLVMFGLLFFSSLVFGRLWCAYLCPAGGLLEVLFAVNSKPVKIKGLNRIRWFVWGLWLLVIVFFAVQAGGYRQVNMLYLTDSGISVSDPTRYVIYYGVILLMALPSLLWGKRAACHTYCWMAPFMVIGRKIRNVIAWPALRLKADSEKCSACDRCTRGCPMSLSVRQMVEAGNMEHSECILCASCIDNCNYDVIRYSFSAGQE